MSPPLNFAVRDEAVRRAGGRCEWIDEGSYPYDMKLGKGTRCRQTLGLQMHHLHYPGEGRESVDDVRMLCDYHHRVQTILDWECPICTDKVFYDVEDAESWLRHVESLDDPPRRVIDLLRDHAQMCSSCEHNWTKDD